jgi:hypothetical protein
VALAIANTPMFVCPPRRFCRVLQRDVFIFILEYSVMYDSGPVPRRTVFSPCETSPEPTSLHPHRQPLHLQGYFAHKKTPTPRGHP